jgi:hypothetical protein
VHGCEARSCGEAGLERVARASALLADLVMRFMGLLRLFAAVLIASSLLGSAASAQDCVVDCSLHRRACMREARTAARGCSMQCREAGDDAQTCLRGCVASFIGAKDTCRSSLSSCLGECPPQDQSGEPSGCRTGCSATLTGCVRDVQTDGRHCARACADAADRAACVSACADTARAGAARCRSGLHTCLDGCGASAVSPTRFAR